MLHAQGAISGCLHRAQPYGSPKFMYFDGSVTWRLNISASLRTQTNAYAPIQAKQNVSNGGKGRLGGSADLPP